MIIEQKGEITVTTTELIRELRSNPAWGYAGDLMLKAADRLEDLEERVAIMEEGRPITNEPPRKESFCPDGNGIIDGEPATNSTNEVSE